MSKVISLKESIDLIKDGDTIAFGSNVLHRSPNRIAKEIVLRNKKDLHLVKTDVDYEVDLLSASRSINRVTAGFVGYETEFGLCRFYRQAVESGSVKVDENACYTVIMSLRAASFGVPFLPVRGLVGSDLIEDVGFRLVKDPYSGQELIAVKSIKPDIAFIHVQEADEDGNARIIGPKYEDSIIARSAKKVIVSCERLVKGDNFTKNPELVDISSVLVDHVVELPKGAKPGSCPGYYSIDKEEISEFQSLRLDEIPSYIRKSLEE